MITEDAVMAARLKQIQESEATLIVLGSSSRSALAAALESAATARVVVPVPRRGRVFLRHGEGHGEFGEVTLTSPLHEAHAD